jgi:hypothetical protein
METPVTMWYNYPEVYHKAVEKLESRKLINWYSGMQTVSQCEAVCEKNQDAPHPVDIFWVCSKLCDCKTK